MSKLISPEAIAKIKARKPYGAAEDTWTIGYLTKGGTYIVASNGRQSDSGKPRDLVAITPFGVQSIWIAVNPDFIAELERALA